MIPKPIMPMEHLHAFQCNVCEQRFMQIAPHPNIYPAPKIYFHTHPHDTISMLGDENSKNLCLLADIYSTNRAKRHFLVQVFSVGFCIFG